ncbi:MAG: hypothetical protein AAGI23_11950 [Bacteroidota bacterium]
MESERRHTATVDGTAHEYHIIEEYEYDHIGRTTKMFHQVKDIANNIIGLRQMCSEMEYDQRNFLAQKRLHGANPMTGDPETDFLQYVDYQYNIRGFLKKINNINFVTGCASPENPTPEGQQPTDAFSTEIS